MTELLEKAFNEACKLPKLKQDALAAVILEELASENEWQKKLAGSADRLAALADEALDEFTRSGSTLTAARWG